MTVKSNYLSDYRGRFAPSPSGQLHFGSLVTAVSSWLDARHNRGQWQVRIDDIDPPREPPGSADSIIRTLERFGLYWDNAISYQSHHDSRYQQALAELQKREVIFGCQCTRALLKHTDIYPGTCRNKPTDLPDSSIRLRVEDVIVRFEDQLQGSQLMNLTERGGDFIIRRKDRLWAYQLATAIDDAVEGITHIVRGIDLMDSTPRQIYIRTLLGLPQPQYGHLPVIINDSGQKLSKQNNAPGIGLASVAETLLEVFRLIGLPDLSDCREDQLLDQASDYWRPSLLANRRTILMRNQLILTPAK